MNPFQPSGSTCREGSSVAQARRSRRHRHRRSRLSRSLLHLKSGDYQGRPSSTRTTSTTMEAAAKAIWSATSSPSNRGRRVREASHPLCSPTKFQPGTSPKLPLTPEVQKAAEDHTQPADFTSPLLTNFQAAKPISTLWVILPLHDADQSKKTNTPLSTGPTASAAISSTQKRRAR